MMFKEGIVLIVELAIIHVINSQSVVVTVQDATAILGENASISCSYTISSGSLFGWSWANSTSNGGSDTVLISSTTTPAPDSRYSVDTSQTDIIILNISKTVKSDEGFYLCTVIQTDVVSNTDFGRLTVQYFRISIVFTTPVNESDTVEMTCTADTTPSPTYTFLKDGEVQQSGSLSTFTIQPASRNDSGSYECRANNSVGTETSDSRTLVVHYLSKPVLSSSNTFVNENESVEMSCSVDANPSPMYTFLKDGEVLQSGSLSTFTIQPASRNDSGSYECRANNSVGTQTSDSRTLDVHYLSKPVLSSSNTSVNENDTVEMSCSVDANPSPMYTFLKDGEVQQSRDLPTYTIQSVSRDDDGSYECRASNSVGTETSDSRTLVVHYLSKPVLSSSNTSVNENDTVEMSCSVDANPSPMYTFLKDGKVLQSGSLSTFTIQSVSRDDDGSYECRASNSVGTETSDSRTLVVHFLGTMMFKIIATPVTEDDNITFVCSVNAKPDPVIILYKDETDDIINATTTNLTHKIANVDESNGGKYKYNASNIAGSGTSEVIQLHKPDYKLKMENTDRLNEKQYVVYEVSAIPSDLIYQWTTDPPGKMDATNQTIFTVNSTDVPDNTTMFTVTANVTNIIGSTVMSISEIFGISSIKSTLDNDNPRECQLVNIEGTSKFDSNPVPLMILFKDGMEIMRDTTNSLKHTITCVKKSDAGIYLFNATNNAGTGTSAEMQLKVRLAVWKIVIIATIAILEALGIATLIYIFCYGDWSSLSTQLMFTYVVLCILGLGIIVLILVYHERKVNWKTNKNESSTTTDNACGDAPDGMELLSTKKPTVNAYNFNVDTSDEMKLKAHPDRVDTSDGTGSVASASITVKKKPSEENSDLVRYVEGEAVYTQVSLKGKKAKTEAEMPPTVNMNVESLNYADLDLTRNLPTEKKNVIHHPEPETIYSSIQTQRI